MLANEVEPDFEDSTDWTIVGNVTLTKENGKDVNIQRTPLIIDVHGKQ